VPSRQTERVLDRVPEPLIFTWKGHREGLLHSAEGMDPFVIVWQQTEQEKARVGFHAAKKKADEMRTIEKVPESESGTVEKLSGRF